MSDFLDRLLKRSLGRASLVQPLLGTRFGSEPLLLEELAGEDEIGGARFDAAISRIVERRPAPAGELTGRRSAEEPSGAAPAGLPGDAPAAAGEPSAEMQRLVPDADGAGREPEPAAPAEPAGEPVRDATADSGESRPAAEARATESGEPPREPQSETAPPAPSEIGAGTADEATAVEPPGPATGWREASLDPAADGAPTLEWLATSASPRAERPSPAAADADPPIQRRAAEPGASPREAVSAPPQGPPARERTAPTAERTAEPARPSGRSVAASEARQDADPLSPPTARVPPQPFRPTVDRDGRGQRAAPAGDSPALESAAGDVPPVESRRDDPASVEPGSREPTSEAASLDIASPQTTPTDTGSLETVSPKPTSTDTESPTTASREPTSTDDGSPEPTSTDIALPETSSIDTPSLEAPSVEATSPEAPSPEAEAPRRPGTEPAPEAGPGAEGEPERFGPDPFADFDADPGGEPLERSVTRIQRRRREPPAASRAADEPAPGGEASTISPDSGSEEPAARASRVRPEAAGDGGRRSAAAEAPESPTGPGRADAARRPPAPPEEPAATPPLDRRGSEAAGSMLPPGALESPPLLERASTSIQRRRSPDLPSDPPVQRQAAPPPIAPVPETPRASEPDTPGAGREGAPAPPPPAETASRRKPPARAAEAAETGPSPRQPSPVDSARRPPSELDEGPSRSERPSIPDGPAADPAPRVESRPIRRELFEAPGPRLDPVAPSWPEERRDRARQPGSAAASDAPEGTEPGAAAEPIAGPDGAAPPDSLAPSAGTERESPLADAPSTPGAPSEGGERPSDAAGTGGETATDAWSTTGPPASEPTDGGGAPPADPFEGPPRRVTLAPGHEAGREAATDGVSPTEPAAPLGDEAAAPRPSPRTPGDEPASARPAGPVPGSERAADAAPTGDQAAAGPSSESTHGPALTRRSATGTTPTEPGPSGPATTEPTGTEQATTEPTGTEPATTEPTRAEAAIDASATTEPIGTEPAAIETRGAPEPFEGPIQRRALGDGAPMPPAHDPDAALRAGEPSSTEPRSEPLPEHHPERQLEPRPATDLGADDDEPRGAEPPASRRATSTPPVAPLAEDAAERPGTGERSEAGAARPGADDGGRAADATGPAAVSTGDQTGSGAHPSVPEAPPTDRDESVPAAASREPGEGPIERRAVDRARSLAAPDDRDPPAAGEVEAAPAGRLDGQDPVPTTRVETAAPPETLSQGETPGLDGDARSGREAVDGPRDAAGAAAPTVSSAAGPEAAHEGPIQRRSLGDRPATGEAPAPPRERSAVGAPPPSEPRPAAGEARRSADRPGLEPRADADGSRPGSPSEASAADTGDRAPGLPAAGPETPPELDRAVPPEPFERPIERRSLAEDGGWPQPSAGPQETGRQGPTAPPSPGSTAAVPTAPAETTARPDRPASADRGDGTSRARLPGRERPRPEPTGEGQPRQDLPAGEDPRQEMTGGEQPWQALTAGEAARPDLTGGEGPRNALAGGEESRSELPAGEPPAPGSAIPPAPAEPFEGPIQKRSLADGGETRGVQASPPPGSSEAAGIPHPAAARRDRSSISEAERAAGPTPSAEPPTLAPRAPETRVPETRAPEPKTPVPPPGDAEAHPATLEWPAAPEGQATTPERPAAVPERARSRDLAIQRRSLGDARATPAAPGDPPSPARTRPAERRAATFEPPAEAPEGEHFEGPPRRREAGDEGIASDAPAIFGQTAESAAGADAPVAAPPGGEPFEGPIQRRALAGPAAAAGEPATPPAGSPFEGRLAAAEAPPAAASGEPAPRADRTTPVEAGADAAPTPALRIPLRRERSDELSRLRPLARQVAAQPREPAFTRVEMRGPVDAASAPAWNDTDLRPPDEPAGEPDLEAPRREAPAPAAADEGTDADPLAAFESPPVPSRPESEPRRPTESDRPGLEIHIGTIEVREPPPPPEAPAPEPFKPRLSLDEYLRRRRAGLR